MNNAERWIVFACVLVLLLGLRVIVQRWKVRRSQRWYEAQLVPTVGWIVQANHKLWVKGDGDSPAVVLVSFDPELANNLGFLSVLAERIFRLKNTEPDDPVERWVADLISDETYRPGARDRLPKPFTDGQKVYAAHVLIRRELLPEGYITRRFIHCKGEPGDDGPIRMIPYPESDRRPQASPSIPDSPP